MPRILAPSFSLSFSLDFPSPLRLRPPAPRRSGIELGSSPRRSSPGRRGEREKDAILSPSPSSSPSFFLSYFHGCRFTDDDDDARGRIAAATAAATAAAPAAASFSRDSRSAPDKYGILERGGAIRAGGESGGAWPMIARRFISIRLSRPFYIQP